MAASTYRNDPFVRTNVNAYVDDPDDGIKELDRLITHHIGTIPQLPRDKNFLEGIQRLVREYVNLFPLYHTRDDKVVEAWGQFWGYKRSDQGDSRRPLWEMKIIWGEYSKLHHVSSYYLQCLRVDSDGYSEGPNHTEILPHFGYEIYFRDMRGIATGGLRRVAGPGHVYFLEDPASLYGRDGQPMHEVYKGICAEANIPIGRPDSSGLLIDRAMRLWTKGADKEVMDYVDGNLQDYNKYIHAPPEGWRRFEKPSFGRLKDEYE